MPVINTFDNLFLLYASVATIQICSWGNFVGGTGWDANPESELKRRMRTGISVSQHELKVLARKIHAREKVSLRNVRDEAVLGLIQILRVMGAETHVEMDNFNSPQLFKKWPKR